MSALAGAAGELTVIARLGWTPTWARPDPDEQETTLTYLDADHTDDFADFVATFVARYRHHWFSGIHESELFPGARETLELLKEAGFDLAVATGKGRAGLDKALRQTGLSGVFSATRCSDETHSKPHPRMLNEILQELQVDSQQTLMVGDTEYDLQMANQAGVSPVAVSYGVHARERLLRHHPLVCLDRITELLDWLAEQRLFDTDATAPESLVILK